MNSLIAVVQAGGLGTRMRELTDDKIPKPMLRLNGKPMIEWQIEAVARYGIKDFVLIIGHLGEQIKEYFGDGAKWGIRISYIEEIEPLGSAGSLYYLNEHLANDYLLIFGDVMFDIDIDRLMKFHRDKQSDITLVSHPNSHPYDSDLLVVDKSEKVIGIIGKKEVRGECYQNLVNSGISVFSRSVLEDLDEAVKTDWERNVVKGHIDEGKVFAYRTSEYIKDAGTPERYRIASKEQAEGLWEKRNLSRKQKCIFLDRDGTINKHVGLVDNPDQIELYPDVVQAIKLINSSGYLAIVVTNQPVVARGLCSEDDVRNINARVEVLLGENGAYLDDIVFCPHHPDKGYPEENPDYKIKCNCRKPAIGMIKNMEYKYNIDLSSSYMVGDTTVDIQTGINAGMPTVLLKTGEAGNDGKYDAEPNIKADTLLDAILKILQEED